MFICFLFVINVFQKGKLIMIPKDLTADVLNELLVKQLERKYIDTNDVFHSEPYMDFNGAGE